MSDDDVEEFHPSLDEFAHVPREQLPRTLRPESQQQQQQQGSKPLKSALASSPKGHRRRRSSDGASSEESPARVRFSVTADVREFAEDEYVDTLSTPRLVQIRRLEVACRYVQMVVAVLALLVLATTRLEFEARADAGYEDDEIVVHFTDRPELQFLFAVGALVTVYSLLFHGDLLLRLFLCCKPKAIKPAEDSYERQSIETLMHGVGLVMDLVFMTLGFAAVGAVFDECAKQQVPDVKDPPQLLCDDDSNIRSAAGLTVIYSVLFLATAAMKFIDWRAMVRREREEIHLLLVGNFAADVRSGGGGGGMHASSSASTMNLNVRKPDRLFRSSTLGTQALSAFFRGFELTFAIFVVVLLVLGDVVTNNDNNADIKYYDVPELQFMFCVTLIGLVYVLLTFAIKVFKGSGTARQRKQRKMDINSVETTSRPFRLVGDVILCALFVAAGIAGISACNKETQIAPTSFDDLCEDTVEWVYAAGVCLIQGVLFGASAAISWKRYLANHADLHHARILRMQHARQRMLQAAQEIESNSGSFQNLARNITFTTVPGLDDSNIDEDAADANVASLAAVRFFEVVLAAIGLFGVVTRDIEFENDDGSRTDYSYNQFSEFQMLVAALALVFIYMLCWIISRIAMCACGSRSRAQRDLERGAAPVDVMVNATFGVLCLAAGIAAGTRCSRPATPDEPDDLCQTTDGSAGIQIGIACAFILLPFQLLHVYLAFQRYLLYRVQDEKEALAAAAEDLDRHSGVVELGMGMSVANLHDV